MAITIEREGGQKSAADLLAPEFIRYRTLIRQDRRRRYLGWAALAVSIVWLALSVLNFFNLASPAMILAGVGLTLLIPGTVLLYEASRPPTLAQTAVSLDSLLDNRQRMITSVELLASGVDKPITEAQLASSAGILQRVNPRKLYPARLPVPQLMVAGGLLLLALGIFILKGLSDDAALVAGNLPPSPNTAQSVPTPSPQSSLPGAAQQKQQPQQQQSGQSSGTPLAGNTQTTGAVSPQQAQQQAADSRDAQKALQRLAQALDKQSVTQAAADAIRQGDYNTAANDLTDLGKNNDQLSDQAKKSMAGALSGAAADSSGAPQLQNAEQNAANALNQGDYAVTSDALAALAQAVKDTGRQVIPQQDLSKDFPDQSGQQGQQGQQNQNSQSGQNGQQGQSDQNGQQAQNGQQGQQGQNGQNGQQDQNGQSGQNGGSQNGQNDQNSPQNQQDQPGSQGSGTGTLPGEGSQVQGPTANKLNVPGNPFVIDGNPDPNANKPGDGKTPPAMTINGSPGGSTDGSAPSQGDPVTANGENNSPPASRWGIVQKYFGGDSQQSQPNQQNSQNP